MYATLNEALAEYDGVSRCERCREGMSPKDAQKNFFCEACRKKGFSEGVRDWKYGADKYTGYQNMQWTLISTPTEEEE